MINCDGQICVFTGGKRAKRDVEKEKYEEANFVRLSTSKKTLVHVVNIFAPCHEFLILLRKEGINLTLAAYPPIPCTQTEQTESATARNDGRYHRLPWVWRYVLPLSVFFLVNWLVFGVNKMSSVNGACSK